MKNLVNALSLGRASLVLACGLLSCQAVPARDDGPRPPEALAPVRQPLIDGAKSTPDQDATVMLVGGGSRATGIMVAPNLVMTAFHVIATFDKAGEQDGKLCVTGQNDATVFGLRDATQMQIFAGADYPAPKAPPKGTGKQVIGVSVLNLCEGDIGFVILNEELTDMPLAPLRLDAKTEPNETYYGVGWGVFNAAGDPTPYRRVLTDRKVLSVGPGQYQPEGALKAFDLFPAQMLGSMGVCYGDSGSGAFSAETNAVIAVVSGIDYTDPSYQNTDDEPAKECTGQAVNYYTRLDYFRTNILEIFKKAGHAPWREGKPRPSAFAAACAEDLDCDSMACIEGACTKACDPAVADSCPTGMSCTVQPQGKVCTKTVEPGAGGGAGSGGEAGQSGAAGQASTPQPQGAACEASEDCLSGLCYLRAEGNVCSSLCDQGPCADGWECIPTGGILACVPPAEKKSDDGGGCAVPAGAGRPVAPIAAALGLLLAGGALRRRRAR